MLYFYLDLDNGDTCVFKGDRVPTLGEAKEFFKETVQYKEDPREVVYAGEVSFEQAQGLWDLEALEALGDDWLFFEGGNV